MGSLHFSEFRAIAKNVLIRDNQQISYANLEKKTGLCCTVSGEPRTFSQPKERAEMSTSLRNQLLRLACSQLGRAPIPGDLTGIKAALEQKLLGKDAQEGAKPLDKRTIVQVVNLVDGMTKQALPLSAFRALVKNSGFGNQNSACTGYEEVLFANESRTELSYGGIGSTRAPMSQKQKASESLLLRKHLLQLACNELNKVPDGKDVKAALERSLLGENSLKPLDVRTINSVLCLVEASSLRAQPFSAFRALVEKNGEVKGDVNTGVSFTDANKRKLGTYDIGEVRVSSDSNPKASESLLLRKHLLQQAFNELSKMPGGVEDVKGALERKLLGENALLPLDTRTVAEVVDLVDGMRGMKKTVEHADTKPPAPTDTSAIDERELREFFAAHDKMVTESSEQLAKTEAQEVEMVQVASVPSESKVVVNTKPLTLKDIAQIAWGAVNGVPDDKLCMGVANGFAVKFLAPDAEQQGEKKVSNRLYNIDKEIINSATENLKNTLLDLAKGLDKAKLESVKTLLTTVPDKNGLALLSCQAVVEAVKIIADELGDTEGGKLSLDDLASVQDAGDVSLDAVLLRTDTRSQKVHAWFDERRNEDLQFMRDNDGNVDIAEAKKRYHLAVYEKVRLNPPDDETIALLDKEFAVVQGMDSELDKVVTRTCTKNPFVLLEPKDHDNYSTSMAINEAIKRTGGPVCADIAADTTMSDGYMTWGSGQEECTTADQSSIVVAYKTAKKEVVRGEHAGTDVLLYTKNDAEDRNLLAAGGYLINSEKMTTDMKLNENQEFQQIKLLYTSMPSFNVGANKDVGGGAAWMRFNLARITGGGYNFTKEQNVNSEKFIAKAFAEARKLGGDAQYGIEGWTCDGKLGKSGEMLMIAEFLHDPAVFDPLADNVDKQVAKLVSIMQEGDYKQLLEKAIANYKATLEATMSKWMKLLVASGAKAYIGTQMGCGWFRNPPHSVAKTFAKLYIEMGADIPIFLPAWKKGEAGPRIWQNAFKEAWAEHPVKVQISAERDAAAALGLIRGRIGSIALVKNPALMKKFLLNHFFEQSFSPNTMEQFKAQGKNALDDLDVVVKSFVEGKKMKGERLLLDMLKRLQAIESAGDKDAQRIEANQKFIDHLDQEVNDQPLGTFTAEDFVTRTKFVQDIKALSGQKMIADYLETFVRNLFKTTFEEWQAKEEQKGRLLDAQWEARTELTAVIIPRIRALASSLSSEEHLSKGVADLSFVIANDLKTWADANCHLDQAGMMALNEYLDGFLSLGRDMAVDAPQDANVATDPADGDVALEQLSKVTFSAMDEGFASDPLEEGVKFIFAVRAMATSGEHEATRIKNMDDFLMGFLNRMAAGGGLRPDHARDIASGLFLVDGAVQDVADLIKDLANSTDGNISADCAHRLSSFLNDCYEMIEFSDDAKSLFCAQTIAVVKDILAHPGDVEALRAFADDLADPEDKAKVAAMREQLRTIASSGKSDVEKRTNMKDYLLNDFFVQNFSSSHVEQFKADLKAQRKKDMVDLKAQRKKDMVDMLKAALGGSRPTARPAAQSKSRPKAQRQRQNDMESMLKKALGDSPKALGDSPDSQPSRVLELGSDLDSVVNEFVEGNNVEGEKLLLRLLKDLQAIESEGGKDTQEIAANRKFIDLFAREIRSAK